MSDLSQSDLSNDPAEAEIQQAVLDAPSPVGVESSQPFDTVRAPAAVEKDSEPSQFTEDDLRQATQKAVDLEGELNYERVVGALRADVAFDTETGQDYAPDFAQWAYDHATPEQFEEIVRTWSDNSFDDAADWIETKRAQAMFRDGQEATRADNRAEIESLAAQADVTDEVKRLWELDPKFRNDPVAAASVAVVLQSDVPDQIVGPTATPAEKTHAAWAYAAWHRDQMQNHDFHRSFYTGANDLRVRAQVGELPSPDVSVATFLQSLEDGREFGIDTAGMTAANPTSIRAHIPNDGSEPAWSRASRERAETMAMVAAATKKDQERQAKLNRNWKQSGR
jgi:hypothetical protein